jgi:hypothetical protein
MNKPCQFSVQHLQFAGTPVEQAQCLLRTVRVGGNVADNPATLPQALLNLIGKPVELNRGQLQSYLAQMGISAADIGGPLDKGVSSTSNGTKARYFVIHDTSDELPTNSFPSNINDAGWAGNNLAGRSTKSAHIFINRLGQSATGHNYSVPWRATKRERDPALRGLFLHHELIQPRIKGSFKFHAVGPQPGFTAAMMDRLALCYVAASLRSGIWMVPAFHCVLDLGISDGHDDPQNFDLFQWGGALEKLVNEILQQPHPEAVAEAAAAAVLELETVRSDLSDGKRTIKVKRIKGTTPLFFKAKFAVDADGAARAYHPDDVPEALDLKKNATSGSKKYIQGQKRNGKLGKGPHPGFYVSETSLSQGNAWDVDSFVDAEFVPYIVLPAHFAKDVATGNLCTVVNLKNFRATAAIFADTNPDVGEASVRAALNLNVNDPAMPITDLAKRGGDVKDNYLYIVYPGQKLNSRAAVPHWPVEEITGRADELFAQWGGIEMARRVVAAM